MRQITIAKCPKMDCKNELKEWGNSTHPDQWDRPVCPKCGTRMNVEKYFEMSCGKNEVEY